MDSIPAEVDFEQKPLYCAFLRQGKAGRPLGGEGQKVCRWGGFFGIWEQESFQCLIYCIPSCGAMASAPSRDSDNHLKTSDTDRVRDSCCLCRMQNQAGGSQA